MANATPVEIERKFLVDREAFGHAHPQSKGQAISQVYDDFGISRGMRYGIERAAMEGRSVEYRQLPAFMADHAQK
jgi:hypothetical protein